MTSPAKTLLLAVFLCLGWQATTTDVRGASFLPTRHDFVSQSGDVLAYVLPAVAFGFTLGLKDGEGSWQLGESAAISMGLTLALKYSVHETRPNGDAHAFPSGHTTISFTTAEFVRKHYGWEYGLPAYALASYVGYCRIHAHQHRFQDVAAGALLGIGTSYFITKPYHGWNIEPVLEARAYGFMASRDF